MVRNNYRSRNGPTSHVRKGLFLSILVGILLFYIGCSSANKVENQLPLKTSENTTSKWEDNFSEDEVISFTREGSEFELISIGEMAINSSGDYFICDNRLEKIFQFDSAGEFIRSIGGPGEGPGEFYIAACPFIDSKDNFYIFDIGKRRINLYSPPDYNFERQIITGTSIKDLIVTDNGDFIFYLTSKTPVLYKTDSKGKGIKNAFYPKQDMLHTFMVRFGLGRFSRISKRDFLFIYPEEYKIYLFDIDLELKRTLYAEASSRFFPSKVKFPKSLSPYSFTPKHSEWWSETLHPAFIYYLDNQKFVVGLFEYTNLSSKLYMNIHDLMGNTYGLGVEVPFNGIVKYAKDGYLYIVEKDRLDGKGNILPLRLHRFKLKIK